MYPLFNHMDKIKYIPDYYKKNKVQRNDIVIIKFAHKKNTIIKKVYGIPNDQFFLQHDKKYNCNIIINNKTVKNSEAKKFNFNKDICKFLSLYVNDYKKVIPANHYVVFGEILSGSLDTSKFGLIPRNNIIGKVVSNSKVQN